MIPYEQAYAAGFEDMRRRVPDTTRARELIGWRPTYDLDGILRSVIEHERARLAGGHAHTDAAALSAVEA